MKNRFFSRRLLPVFLSLMLLIAAYKAYAAGPKVSAAGNKHNLSAANTTVFYRAVDDPVNNPKGQQICVFCHTPHNANVAGHTPLWNRAFSSQSFQRYSSATLKIRSIAGAQYASGAQPDGASKLCLSCHDGVSKLGDVLGTPIAMVNNVITTNASFDPSTTNKMKVGHHPVSFVYDTNVVTAIGGSYVLPTLQEVKLDRNKKMQCTTCHDPHQNMTDDNYCYGAPNGTCNGSTRVQKVAPFWVYGNSGNADTDQQTVCTTCHPMTTVPWP